MPAIDRGRAGQDPEGLERELLETLAPRLIDQLPDQAPAEPTPPQARVEEEEADHAETIALVGEREAPCELPAVLDDPDAAPALGPAAAGDLRHGRRDVALEVRVEVEFLRVEAAVLADDLAEVAGTKLAPDLHVSDHELDSGPGARSKQDVVVTVLIVNYD